MAKKTGTPAKGSEIINKIINNRIPRGKRRIVEKAIKEAQAELNKQKDWHDQTWPERAEHMREVGLKTKAEKKEEMERAEAIADEIDAATIEDDEVLSKIDKKLKNDLLWVLNKLGGRQKILDMAKKSDALTITIVKEILRVEVRELEARLRSKEAGKVGNQPGFFFCITGLEDKKKMQEVMGNMKFLEQVISPKENIIDIESEEKNET
jgi:hypothetical protein